MSITQNHIQFLRTSGNTAPSTSNLLEGEIAANIDSSNPKLYLRTKTGIAEFGNTGKNIILGEDIIHISQIIAESSLTISEAIAKFYTALAESEEINAGAINNLKDEIDAIPTITGVTYTGVTGSPVSQISLLDKELVVGRRPDMYVNTALTLSGFTVTQGTDDSTDTVTVTEEGAVGVVYKVGNEVRYKYTPVVNKITVTGTNDAPIASVTGSKGEVSLNRNAAVLVNSAKTSNSAITSNSAQTLSGFEVVDDTADITYTIPPGKGVGIIVQSGNTIKYKLKDVVRNIESNEATAPSGKAVGRILINKGQEGDVSYTYDYVDLINSATTASQINGMKIETLTRSEYDEKVKENNTLYLIYESPNG